MLLFITYFWVDSLETHDQYFMIALKSAAHFCMDFILENFHQLWWLESVAGSVIEANARPELEDGLRTGALLYFVLRWISVRTKLGVNMGNLGEPELTRLSKYVGIGPDPKGGSSNYKRLAVVG